MKIAKIDAAEELANVISHGVWFVIVVGAIGWYAPSNGGRLLKIGYWLYALTLCILFASSTLYHLSKLEGWESLVFFKLIDHLAIFMLIAQTTTPILLAHEDQAYRVVTVATTWLLCGAGMSFKIFSEYRYHPQAVWSYIFTGGIGIFLAALVNLSWECRACLILGGIVYMAGALLFFVKDEIRWNHLKWHLVVILASGIHFLGIVFFVIPRLKELKL